MSITNCKKWGVFIFVIGMLITLFYLLEMVFTNWYVEQHLGQGYSLQRLSSNTSIVMYGKQTEVINDPVYSIDHDRRWIIIKTVGNDYYVIDKRHSLYSKDDSINVIGPMDSTSFYNLKNKQEIALCLRTIPRDDL